MKSPSVGLRAMALLAVSAPTAVACVTHVLSRRAAVMTRRLTTIDELVGTLAALGAWAVVGWVAVTVTLAATAALPGALGSTAARVASAVTPRVIRRLVLVVVGVTIAGGAAPAFASTALPGAASDGASATPGPAVVANQSVGATSVPIPAAHAELFRGRLGLGEDDWPRLDRPAERTTVVVQPGDCLWTIARDQLEPGVGPAEVAAEWPRWYEANRALIGPDPDLIRPGQRLTAPPPP